jgi:hypothetical protein
MCEHGTRKAKGGDGARGVVWGIGHSHTDRLRFQEGMQVDPRRARPESRFRASPRNFTMKCDSEIPGAGAGLGPVQTKFKRYAVSSELLLVTSGERAGLGKI